MANHHAAALLLTASLLVVVALSGADARPTVLPDKTLAALPGANDANGQGVVDAAAEAVVDPDCDDDDDEKPSGGKHHKKHHKPKTPELPCNTCEEPREAELTCNKVHAVRDGETCHSMRQCAGLGQDDFLRFNPNIWCDHLFTGQWVCLDATCAA